MVLPNHLKRIVFLLLAFCLLLSMTACRKDHDDGVSPILSSNSPTSQAQGIFLTTPGPFKTANLTIGDGTSFQGFQPRRNIATLGNITVSYSQPGFGGGNLFDGDLNTLWRAGTETAEIRFNFNRPVSVQYVHAEGFPNAMFYFGNGGSFSGQYYWGLPESQQYYPKRAVSFSIRCLEDFYFRYPIVLKELYVMGWDEQPIRLSTNKNVYTIGELVIFYVWVLGDVSWFELTSNIDGKLTVQPDIYPNWKNWYTTQNLSPGIHQITLRAENPNLHEVFTDTVKIQVGQVSSLNIIQPATNSQFNYGDPINFVGEKIVSV